MKKFMFLFMVLATVLILVCFNTFAYAAADQAQPENMFGNILNPQLVNLLITAILIPLAVKLIKILGKALENKIGNDHFNKYIDIGELAIETAVTSTAQTFVKEMKETGRFDQKAKENAFNQAKNIVFSILTTTAKKELAYIYGDLNTWIDSRIEYYVSSTKR